MHFDPSIGMPICEGIWGHVHSSPGKILLPTFFPWLWCCQQTNVWDTSYIKSSFSSLPTRSLEIPRISSRCCHYGLQSQAGIRHGSFSPPAAKDGVRLISHSSSSWPRCRKTGARLKTRLTICQDWEAGPHQRDCKRELSSHHTSSRGQRWLKRNAHPPLPHLSHIKYICMNSTLL